MNSVIRQFAAAFVFIFLFTISSVFAQQAGDLFTDIRENFELNKEKRSSIPQKYRSLKLNLPALKNLLSTAPDEFSPNAFSNGAVLSLPLPDGSYSRFRVVQSKVMHDDLAKKFPMIRTYTAAGMDDKYATAKLDITEWGFHAMIISPSGWVFIDPASQSNTTDYICYVKDDSQPTGIFVCESENVLNEKRLPLKQNALFRSAGTQLKTYRLAMACTGEYATFHGGTVSGAMSGITTTVNRVNGVYELEMSVRMVLIANNNLLVFTNSGSDPYTNSNGSTMLGQNISTCSTTIGNANFDIGHVVSTGGGGVAYLGVICNNSLKAGGVTGSGAPVGDAFDIDYVAHEMGHQFGGDHTFNSVTSSCNGNRVSTSAYEPGSGVAIMGYAGICAADNILPNSIPIFHSRSFDQIQDHITTGGGQTCAVITSTGNFPPAVPAGINYSIPISTPFVLTGSATDANSDPMTYLWEQFDLGPAGSPNSPSGNAPLFRLPTTSPSRTFPRIQDIVRNIQTLGEILPSYARSMKFRLVVRDNRPNGGGVSFNDTLVTLSVINTTTPFRVTSPNTAVTWFNNINQTVTWDVSSTNVAPINCSLVNILLSLDSGYTFPHVLASNTANDGSQSVLIPNVTGNKARIKVESVGNVFFDMSNVNFTISSSAPSLTTITTSPLSSNNICAGNGISVSYTADGPANGGNIFTAQLSDSNASFSSPVNIGSLASTTSGTISATIQGSTLAASGYRIRVVSSTPVVTGTNNGADITVFQVPGTPGSISGLTTVCQGQTGVVFSVSPVANATSYQWTLPSDATITAGANTNSITVTFSAAAVSGNITVQGTNAGCGNGPLSPAKSITVNVLPGAAGSVSGTSTVCQNATGIAYTVPPISNATGYIWTLPSGASITSGNNTNSITVSFSPAAVSGFITVRGTNSCGNGTLSPIFSVTVNSAPPAPVVSPAGPVSICSPGSVNLSFTSTPGVTYQWRKNGVNIGGETGTSYMATTNGNYDVVATFATTGPQTFSNPNRSFIPDNTCPGGATGITVSGYNGAVNTAGITMTINVTHTWVGDLVIMMETPEGSYLGLSNRTGNSNNSGNDFINTVFSDAGAIPIPTTGAPYTDTYKPVATSFSECFGPTLTSFAAIGGGNINPNGQWALGVFDRANVDTGSIQNWSISFPASLPNACTSVSNSVTVTLTTPLTASVSIAASPGDSVCTGTQVTFTATPVNGGSTPAYIWKNGATTVGSNSSTYMTSSLQNGDVISCIMTSNASCVTGSPDTSNAIMMEVVPAPVINSFSPPAGNIGTIVTVNGSGFTGTTAVSFNGTPTGFTVLNDATISTSVPAGATSGAISVTTACGTAMSSVFVISGSQVTLNLKLFLEGFYEAGPGGGIQNDNAGAGGLLKILGYTSDSSLVDTIFISAMDASTFSEVERLSTLLHLNGTAKVTFSNAIDALTLYYIKVNHRNSLETWSSSPVYLSIPYDFTTAQTKAYGSNMVPTFDSNGWAFISGDISDAASGLLGVQDGSIESQDYSDMENSVYGILSGYIVHDLTGDALVESFDYSVMESNVFFIRSVVRP